MCLSIESHNSSFFIYCMLYLRHSWDTCPSYSVSSQCNYVGYNDRPRNWCVVSVFSLIWWPVLGLLPVIGIESRVRSTRSLFKLISFNSLRPEKYSRQFPNDICKGIQILLRRVTGVISTICKHWSRLLFGAEKTWKPEPLMTSFTGACMRHQEPILLTWFKFNPSIMEK